jgi:hypothetical protein
MTLQGGDAPRELVRQILNPLCAEDGWMQVVAALDRATKQSILSGTAAAGDESDADLEQLVVADDDGEPTAGEETPGATGVELDFNKLSEVVAALRPAEPLRLSELVPQTMGGLFATLGLVLLLLAWRHRASSARKP